MRIGEVARLAGDLTERRLPEIDALTERAQRMRSWLQAVTSCDCERIDDCALSDDATLSGSRPV